MDGIGALSRLAAQLDVAALLRFSLNPALRLGGFDCGQEEKARVGGVRHRARKKNLFVIFILLMIDK